MDKIEKSRDSDNRFQSHCFPVFHGMTPVNESEEEEACHLFRPTYENQTEKKCYRPSSIQSPDSDPEQNDEAGKQKQKSFDQGVIAGQNDAQCLIQDELTPIHQEFILAINQLNERLEQLTGDSVRNIIQLSLEIVHKIIGKDVSLSGEDLTPICQEIRATMNRAYAINLRMNADDFENLSAMANCSSVPIISGDGVGLSGDAQVPKGALCQDDDDSGLSLATVSKKITQLLEDLHSS